jgi:Ni/Fe-hydrogenase subunit HybB-like protein
MDPAYNVIIHKELLPGGSEVVVPIVLGDMKHDLWLYTSWPYIPSIVEFTITIGWLAGIALVLYVLAKLLFGRR